MFSFEDVANIIDGFVYDSTEQVILNWNEKSQSTAFSIAYNNKRRSKIPFIKDEVSNSFRLTATKNDVLRFGWFQDLKTTRYAYTVQTSKGPIRVGLIFSKTCDLIQRIRVLDADGQEREFSVSGLVFGITFTPSKLSDAQIASGNIAR